MDKRRLFARCRENRLECVLGRREEDGDVCGCLVFSPSLSIYIYLSIYLSIFSRFCDFIKVKKDDKIVRRRRKKRRSI